MISKLNKLVWIFLLMISVGACRDAEELNEINQEIEDVNDEETDLSDYPDWSVKTHSNDADPDYDIVFAQNEVLRFDISISSENWAAMQSDLSSLLGSTGGRPGPGGSPAEVEGTPMWVKCALKFNDMEWYNVGVRYKGNSSLKSAYQSGNKKLSLKLDFDEFEEDYPALKNQRFYGFKQLNLNNNFDDASFMREKVGADLFRQFGLISAQTAFCVVYVDNGTGPQYYGVYALVEEMDDTVIETQVGDDSGNLYKPDGDAASFSSGSFDEGEMEKKNNEDLADYSDVQSLYNIINSNERVSNVEAWKINVEAVFNVDGFMKWLAANTVIQNWDTYGRMTHNYYLYNNTGVLNWIPWDNNEAFQYGKQGGALSFSFNEVGTTWPLITYLASEDEYKEIYEDYMLEFIQTVFIPATMSDTYNKYYDLLKDYAYGEESGYSFLRNDAEFDAAVETIILHAQTRNDAVINYLQ